MLASSSVPMWIKVKLGVQWHIPFLNHYYIGLRLGTGCVNHPLNNSQARRGSCTHFLWSSLIEIVWKVMSFTPSHHTIKLAYDLVHVISTKLHSFADSQRMMWPPLPSSWPLTRTNAVIWQLVTAPYDYTMTNSTTVPMGLMMMMMMLPLITVFILGQPQ